MIGRPKNFDEQAALAAAMELFWRRGYGATSLDDLLRATSLSKSSFYAEFKSKPELYRSCLLAYQTMLVERLKAKQSQAASLRDFLTSIFEGVINDASSGAPRGCLVFNSAVEFGQHRSEFSADVKRAMAAIEKTFEAIFKDGLRSGEITSQVPPRTLARYLMTCISGTQSMIKGGLSLKSAQAVAHQVVDSIVA